MTVLKKYWLCSLLGTLLISSYPLLMGARVIADMLMNGAVRQEDYPKYIIPYTPIAVSVIFAVLLMPLVFRLAKRLYLLAVSLFSVVVFLIAELCFENLVIVEESSLESWQMYTCYVAPDGYATRSWKAVDVLIGDYSPAFKLHFYLIALVLIVAVLNVIYGFGNMILSENYKRRRALIVQSVCTVLFLGMCILACFTAFFRGGELTVSPLSAVLMALFFLLLGVTVGVYVASFLLSMKKFFAVWIPAIVASLVTLLMYVGELCLLSGHLYRLGSGRFFDGILGTPFSGADLSIILFSGLITALIAFVLRKEYNA